MRRTGMMLLLGAVVAAGAASAHAVIVDFGTLGGSSASTTGTSNPAGLTLNGVTMLYDDQGEDEDDFANPVTAQVDRFGIFGSAAGKLILDLGPATGMTLGFSLLTVTQPEDLPDALIAIFSDGDVVTMGATLDSQGDAFGTLAYTSPASFDHVEMYFLTDTMFFGVDSLSYTPVPEPATLTLLAGLLGLGGWLRRRGRPA